MVCNFGSWPQNYLTMPEAFWTSMFHCFRPVVQFPWEICSRIYAVMLPVVLIFDICNVYKIVASDLLYSVMRSGKDGRYGIKNFWKHWRLAFVFSLLVWFCETATLHNSVLLQKNDLISTIFALMYRGKPHAQECIFQWSRLSKSKTLSSVKLWWSLK